MKQLILFLAASVCILSILLAVVADVNHGHGAHGGGHGEETHGEAAAHGENTHGEETHGEPTGHGEDAHGEANHGENTHGGDGEGVVLQYVVVPEDEHSAGH